MSDGSIDISDPMAAPKYDGALSRFFARFLYDPRDEVFVRLTLKVTVIMLSAMVLLKLFFSWWLVPVYLVLWGWYSAPVILMLHNTMHRPFIRRSRLANRAHPYLMTFLFGIPTGYMEHHVGMHHVEDNGPDDLSCTRSYQRDSFLHFLVYFSKFFFLSIIELPLYLSKHKRSHLAVRAVASEAVHVAIIALALAWDWRWGLVCFAFQYFAVRFLMMVGNWGQHAFLSTTRFDGIGNSITCINAGYNQRAFNDGYHIGHHLKANRHWTEMPADFLAQKELYRREDAIVFEGLDFFLVSILLFLKRYEFLAKKFVRLDGKPRSNEDVIALLKSRLKPLEVEEQQTQAEVA